MSAQPLAVVVLAAGIGKRFKSAIPKVLHRVGGRSLVEHVVAAAAEAGAGRLVVVVGRSQDRVIDQVRAHAPEAIFVTQPQQLGTGDAVRRCREALQGFAGSVLVTNADCPLIRPQTFQELVARHRKAKAGATLLTARMPDPTGYGRVVRDAGGRFVAIVEEADASPAEQAIDEVSTGLWCFEPGPLFEALGNLTPDNAQGEYYLTDAAWEIASKGGIIDTMAAENPQEAMGVNDRAQLAEAARELRARKMEKLMAAGVTIEDPAATYIDDEVEIGPDTIVRPNTYLEGNTRIGGRCTIGPQTQIVDSAIGDGARVCFAVVIEAEIADRCLVGPFAYLRPGTRLLSGAKAGTFVEMTRSTIGEGTKVPHLSYIGDTEIGKDANIGAGTITGNYDGETGVKSKTLIADEVLTGSGTTIVAPVEIGKGAVTGAGSVVTKDVGDGDVVMGVPAKQIRRRKRTKPSE